MQLAFQQKTDVLKKKITFLNRDRIVLERIERNRKIDFFSPTPTTHTDTLLNRYERRLLRAQTLQSIPTFNGFFLGPCYTPPSKFHENRPVIFCVVQVTDKRTDDQTD